MESIDMSKKPAAAAAGGAAEKKDYGSFLKNNMREYGWTIYSEAVGACSAASTVMVGV